MQQNPSSQRLAGQTVAGSAGFPFLSARATNPARSKPATPRGKTPLSSVVCASKQPQVRPRLAGWEPGLCLHCTVNSIANKMTSGFLQILAQLHDAGADFVIVGGRPQDLLDIAELRRLLSR